MVTERKVQKLDMLSIEPALFCFLLHFFCLAAGQESMRVEISFSFSGFGVAQHLKVVVW